MLRWQQRDRWMDKCMGGVMVSMDCMYNLSTSQSVCLCVCVYIYIYISMRFRFNNYSFTQVEYGSGSRYGGIGWISGDFEGKGFCYTILMDVILGVFVCC
jgi:hypothetical protein